MDCKLLHPNKDCAISVGVRMPNAHCPQNKWLQKWTTVICNPTRENVRVAHSLGEVVVVGDIPNWYLGKSIILPPKHHRIYSDRLRWLQHIIDCNYVTETFLWVEDSVAKLPFNEYRQPILSPNPINPHEEKLLRENKRTTFNYQTEWPTVLNKGRLQEVMDIYRQPYHVGTIYHNHYATPHKEYTSLPRECMPVCDLEI